MDLYGLYLIRLRTETVHFCLHPNRPFHSNTFSTHRHHVIVKQPVRCILTRYSTECSMMLTHTWVDRCMTLNTFIWFDYMNRVLKFCGKRQNIIQQLIIVIAKCNRCCNKNWEIQNEISYIIFTYPKSFYFICAVNWLIGLIISQTWPQEHVPDMGFQEFLIHLKFTCSSTSWQSDMQNLNPLLCQVVPVLHTVFPPTTDKSEHESVTVTQFFSAKSYISCDSIRQPNGLIICTKIIQTDFIDPWTLLGCRWIGRKTSPHSSPLDKERVKILQSYIRHFIILQHFTWTI